jgi:enolase
MQRSTIQNINPLRFWSHLESGWVLANQRFMAFHAEFLSGVLFFLASLVWTGVISVGGVFNFLGRELPSSILLAFIARHCIVAAHMMGHYLEARKQGILAEDVEERVNASGIEKDIEKSRSKRLVWYLKMFLLIPYGRFPGVDRSGGLFMPNLYVRTKGYNLAVQARGPQIDKKISDFALWSGIPLFVAGILFAGIYPEWLQYVIRFILIAGVISRLDVNRTDNQAYRKFKEEEEAAKRARKQKPAEVKGAPAETAALLEKLIAPESAMNSCTIPIDTQKGTAQEIVRQSHQFRPIIEGRGDGANISMAKFGIVVLGGNERFCEIFITKVQDRIKFLLQKTPGLTHLGLSTSGSERGTLSYGAVELERIKETPPEHELSDEEAVRVLVQATKDCGGALYGTPAKAHQAQVIIGVAPEADKLARAYEHARHAKEVGKYLFDLREGEKLEADSQYLIKLYKRWHELYGVRLFINPFAEDDITGYENFKKELGDRVIVASSNLLRSSAGRIRSFNVPLKNLIDAIVLLPGQIGTFSEIIAAAIEAEKHGLQIIMSRSAEATTDSLEADLALGIGVFMDDFGGARNVEVLDKISRKQEIMNIFNEKIASGKPDRDIEDVTIVDMKAYSFLTNARVPTMRVVTTLSNGAQFYADSPVGQFAKKNETKDIHVAAHLVDGNEREYQGNNCRIAIKHFDEMVTPIFLNKSIWELPELIEIERMLLAKEKEFAENQGILPKYSDSKIAFNKNTDDIKDKKILEKRNQIKQALARKAGLGLQPIAAASIVLARIIAYRDGKQLVQLVREHKLEEVDEDYLYGFKEKKSNVAHLQGHWILANHNFMSFHIAFLSGVMFFLRSLVIEHVISAGNLKFFLLHNVAPAIVIAAILSAVIYGISRMSRYLRERRLGKLSNEIVTAVRKSGIEKDIENAGSGKKLLWYIQLFYKIPTGKYPGVPGVRIKSFIGLSAVLTFFGLWLIKFIFPADDLISFFVRELGNSIILAGLIGHLSIGIHEAGHYIKARIMNRLADDVVKKIKEHPVLGPIEKNIFIEDAQEIMYRELPFIKKFVWRILWVGYIILTAPLGKFPGVELSGSHFTPNITVRTKVQGKDALPIRAQGPLIDQKLFVSVFPVSLALAGLIVLVLQGSNPHLSEWIQIFAQFLFGFGIVSGLNINATDEGAYKEQKQEQKRTTQRASELKEALVQVEKTPSAEIGAGAVIANPREYFIKKRLGPDTKGISMYVTEDGIKERIIFTNQQRNTVQGGLHVDLIKKGKKLLGGYEVIIAIGNLHLQEFMLIPDTDDEEAKAAICSAIQLEVVKILNKYKGLMNVGQGLEGGQAVNLTYGGVPFSDISGYEWITDARYPGSTDDPDRPFYMEEIHEGDDEDTIAKKKLYQIPEEEAWKVLLLATINAGYTPGNKIVSEDVLKEKPRVWFGMDGATSSLYFEYNRSRDITDPEDCIVGYRFWKDPAQKELRREEFIRIYTRWLTRYPIAWIEDPFGETDREAWKIFYNTKLPDGRRIGDNYIVVADDNVTTDETPIRIGKRRKAFNSVLIKLNQIGSVSETVRAIVASLESVICDSTYDILGKINEALAEHNPKTDKYKQNKTHLARLINNLEHELKEEEEQIYNVVISHRSQSPDDYIEAEVANASNALGGKMGGSLNLERQSKYFRMLLNTDFVRRGIQMFKFRPNNDNYRKKGKDIKIASITPQEIFVNSGTPTVRVTIRLSDGSAFSGACPIGTSAGTTEAVHGLDYRTDEFKSKGCLTALEHAREIAQVLTGKSIWSESVANIRDIDRSFSQMELAKLKESAELQDMIDNALKSARAQGLKRPEAHIRKDVIITSQKRKRKLWMNAILPASIACLRMLGFRDGKYTWQIFREEIHKIILSRLPKYAARDKIRQDIHKFIDKSRNDLKNDKVDTTKTIETIESLHKRIADYWENENYDAHSDYIYGFDDEFNPERDWQDSEPPDTAKEFTHHGLTPPLPDKKTPA